MSIQARKNNLLGLALDYTLRYVGMCFCVKDNASYVPNTSAIDLSTLPLPEKEVKTKPIAVFDLNAYVRQT